MNPFSEACGAAGPLDLTIEDREAGRSEVRSLDQPYALIGRDTRCEIALDSRQISRRHAYLQIVEGRIYWIDLDSRGGTFDRGERRPSGWLERGRSIGIGPYEIRVPDDTTGSSQTAGANSGEGSGQAALASPLLWRGHGRLPLPGVSLEFLNGPSKSTSWPMHRVMSLIGSAKGCKFRLSDSSVSAFHCSLLRTPDGLFVVDLLGESGITVNGQRARTSRLDDSDVLEIGRYRIRIRCRAPRSSSGQSSSVATDRAEPNQTQSVPFWAASTSMPIPTMLHTSPSLPAFGPEALSAALRASLPAQVERSELTEAVIVPLVSQFGLMQQQMFDQFQQAMGMLVSMFGTMHRNQMDVIREELDRLHELSREFQELKAELARMSDSRGPNSDGTATNPNPGRGPGAVVSPPPFKASPGTRLIPNPPLSSNARSMESVQGMKVSVSKGSNAERQAVSASATPGERVSPSLPLPSDSANSSPASGTEADPEGASQPDRDMILWLHQRISTIQDERETRWQKILKLLPGVS